MKSMTGFGRGVGNNGTLAVSVELSSLNRKQLEVAVSLPKHLTELETFIRKEIAQKISRGRVMAQISIQNIDEGDENTKLDQKKVQLIQREFRALEESLGSKMTLSPADILSIPHILIQEEVSIEAVEPLLTEGTDIALEQLIVMREREGDDLKTDCELRLSNTESLLDKIITQAPLVVENYRTNLIARLEEFSDLKEAWEVDERLLKEVALYADRSDISEEITRFQSHLDKFQEYLAKDEPVGRPLDFLCQELNRELNTIGAKANDATLAQLVVEGKTEIEKIREQIQNVE